MTHVRTSARAKGSVPAYRDIYQRVRSEILSGRLSARARLPSSRTLAGQLGVARGKQQHDKRQTIKKKEQDRELRRIQMTRQ